MIRWYKTGGKRYVVIDVHGYAIGASRRGSQRPGVTYAVCDTAHCWREVEVFRPGGRNGPAIRKQKADDLAAELNREDEAERHRDRRAALKVGL